MNLVNVERIINGTPAKRILNGYNTMKQNYSESSAQEYYAIYSKESLSSIMESSRLIFSEPYCGYEFYKGIITDNTLCNFNAMESECDKVESFFEENKAKMGSTQREMYESLINDIHTALDHTKNTRIFSSYIKENLDDTFEKKLSDALYEYKMSEEKDSSKVVSLFESKDDIHTAFITYAPYVMSCLNKSYGDSSALNEKAADIFESICVDSDCNLDEWKTYVESILCANKLKHDKAYMESINTLTFLNQRDSFKMCCETSLENDINDIKKESVNAEDFIRPTSTGAVNSIFDDMLENSFFGESFREKKEEIERLKAVVYEAELNILVKEYQMSENTDDITEGYSFVEAGSSLETAFEKISSLYNESVDYITESDEEDEEDNEIDDDEERSVSSGKKPVAPKPKNLANKVQFSAMDKEAKQMRKMADREQKGQEIKNAVRAVTKIPKNIIDKIKADVHKFDEMDDERRKEYMTEPGFRKKAFRNLKLSILYGSAATTKLSLVPVVMMARHFSKTKDRRIRNELIRELNTEIKVCEEKIVDANANNDTKQKYHLMRIKDKLDAEMVRVKTNSKYV